ncbi:HD domain-containing protein [Desertibacillus haloalkaliphilus]|uniref:HD domain-containing protein n=1 Tax=Desertibacillus haloalkaliphilus TaxID=1328930 RepID=UPI001C25AB0D|nr:HD domain-containing protein [Desertibacillus haloalkaliphilus]MBU8907304.1 HD domain-containing protein [Desertibacillus haloalkaliphilus]
MDRSVVLSKARDFVQQELAGESSGHDWWHIYRVTNLAKRIAVQEGGDEFLCELTALLHDLADEKLYGDEQQGLARIRSWLTAQGVSGEDIDHILAIITAMSFKGGQNKQQLETIEGKVVQDADRLDAIGAIGIARTFAYGGAKGQLIYDPDLKSRSEMTYDQYREGKSTSVNHFYEKLFKLKDLMNTSYAKKLAEERHQVMEQFLAEFYREWDGDAEPLKTESTLIRKENR